MMLWLLTWSVLALCALKPLAQNLIFAVVAVLVFVLWFGWRKVRVIGVVLLVFVLRLALVEDTAVPLNCGRVESLTGSGAVVETMGGKVFVIGQDLIYDQEICFEGELQEIPETLSDHTGGFYQWAQSKQIHFSVKPESITVYKTPFTLSSWLYRQIQAIENPVTQSFFLQLFFGLGKQDWDIFSLFRTSGLIYGGLARMVRDFMGRYVKGWRKELTSSLTMVFLCLNFGAWLILAKHLILRFLRWRKLDSRRQLCYCALVLLLIEPAWVSSQSFWLALGIEYLYQLYHSRRLAFALSSIPLRLATSYSFSFGQLALGLCLQPALPIIWLSCLVLCLSECTGILDGVIGMLANTAYPRFVLTGKLPLWGVFLWFQLASLWPYQKVKVILSLSLVLFFNQVQWLFDPFVTLTQLSVGQGDAMVLHFPFAPCAIVLDTGPPTSYSYLQNELNARGIRCLEGLILSHNDSDHAGNRDALIQDYQIKAVIDNKQPQLVFEKITMTQLLYDKHYESANDDSLILLFTIGDLTFLYPGDISADVERDLVSSYPGLKMDVLKAAHHGSKTSSSDLLIDRYPWRYALFSTGVNNPYHHPHYSIVLRYQKSGIPTLDTAKVGDIRFFFWGDHAFIHTTDNEFVIIK